MNQSLMKRTVAACLVGLLMAPVSQAFASSSSTPQTGSQTRAAVSPAQPDAAQNPSNAAQATPNQQPGNKPLGTAVAPYETTSGVTASRPAGAVIAPAKQRRARTILIRIGVVVGAAAAVGTVVALSHASPSQPH